MGVIVISDLEPSRPGTRTMGGGPCIDERLVLLAQTAAGVSSTSLSPSSKNGFCPSAPGHLGLGESPFGLRSTAPLILLRRLRWSRRTANAMIPSRTARTASEMIVVREIATGDFPIEPNKSAADVPPLAWVTPAAAEGVDLDGEWEDEEG